MRPTLLPVPALLAAIAGLAAAEPQIVADPALPAIIPQADPAVAAGATLFVSSDRGATWQRIADAAFAATAPVPAFRWTAPGDGEYAIVTPVRFRPGAGADQAEPVPGQLPPHALQVVVDTTPPAVEIESAEARPGEVTVRWSARDAHFTPEPVSLDLSVDGGRSFAAVRTLPPSGSITVPAVLAAGVSAPLVRLTARDRAGLVATTPAVAAVTAKPTDPVALLQQAVA
ncbi:MAG: hypothetical protein RLZZ127_3007, partial [Planctomycetota bacterium]